MTLINKSLFSLVCFEGEDDSAADAAAAESAANAAAAAADAAANAASGKPGAMFSQEDINKFLAEDRRKHVDKYKQLEASYQGILTDRGLAAGEREKLQGELDDLQKSFRTKEQQMEFDRKQAAGKYENELSELKSKASKWEGMYKSQVVETSLANAAMGGDAFNPTQIIGLLQPMTELRPELDDAGHETGRLMPVIDFPDIDEKTGEQVKTLRSPADAVRRMKELPEHWGNLFNANVVSGVGSGSAAGSAANHSVVDASRLTPEQYQKMRRENPEAVGLRRRPTRHQAN